MATDTEANPKDLDGRYRIDEDRRVYVYRNLHKGCWSVRQDGLIKLHTDHICLFDCQFRVGQKGREKVLREKRKNVHAGINGYIDTFEVDKWEGNNLNTARTSYNPYKNETFVDTAGAPVYWSRSVKLETGCCSHGNMIKDEVRFVPCIDGANFC